MEQQQLLQADYLDIIFDHRNKKYGGYDLRKHYASRAGRAVAGVLGFTAIIAVVPVLMSMNEPKINSICIKPFEHADSLTTVQIYHPPKIVTPPAVQPSGMQTKMEKFTEPVIKPTKLVADEVKPIEDPTTIVGPKDADGPSNTPLAGTGTSGSPGIGIGPDNLSGSHLVDDKPITVPDEFPTFNGNMAAYLQNHLHYPENAREMGKEGRVIIKFVVGEDGAILDAGIARSAFQSLDAEALRVVKSMPKWKPGRVKGKAVKVYFSVPISFVLSDAGAGN